MSLSDPDDKLNATFTGANGRFSISGSESETHRIKPYVKIAHDCNRDQRQVVCEHDLDPADIYDTADEAWQKRPSYEIDLQKLKKCK